MKKFIPIICLIFGACSKGGGLPNEVDLSISANSFTITDESQLLKGPLAQGQVGDFLLENDKVSFVIQKASKFAQSCPFGGVIIDADLKKDSKPQGADNFGKMCPMVNVEWTVNYQNFQVISDGKDGGAKILRAIGIIDVLDYLDLDFIAPVSKALTGQTMYYSQRFDDANDPFAIYDDMRALNTTVVTDYILEPGKNYIRMETTFENNGDSDAYLPIGRLVNGSGEIQLLLPGQGFTPQPTAQITADTVGIVYVPFEGVEVSYGYFYDVRQFALDKVSAGNAAKAIVGANKAVSEKERLISTSLTYSGVTGVILGDELLKVLPLGGPGDVKVNFSVPKHGKRTVTEYFIVGSSDAGEVFTKALDALKISTRKISGKVVDSAGNAVSNAKVVVQNEKELTVIVYRTAEDGSFSGELSTGRDTFDKAFGSGKYKIFAEKAGYHKEGANTAGVCEPSIVDMTIVNAEGIVCVIGSAGTVTISGGVKDTESGMQVPSRLTIVGFDPSPDSHAGAAYATTHGSGKFEDTWIFERPWGIVDVKYINAKGGLGLTDETSFKLEPGHYAFVFSRGVEYGLDVREIDLSANSTVTIDNVKLKRLIKTPGWISADFHLHSIYSPDSAMSVERRALASVGEGMDVLQSSDHDWLVDYQPSVEKLEKSSLIPVKSVATVVGDEISPNHYGHIHVFPLELNHDKIDGGAFDWTDSPYESISPSPDFVASPQDIIDHYRYGEGAKDGEKVLQVNHISDQATSLPILSGWVTTTGYKNISPLSSYVEPSSQRIKPASPTTQIPIPLKQSELVITDFTAVELTIGSELYTNDLRHTGLPQWFNLLNLGILATGTADSDSHRETVDQLGMPRNFIASSVDPRDGSGSFSELDKDSYAHAINEHKVVVSAGPFINVTAVGENKVTVGVGEVVKGKDVTLHIDVKSPSWAWFDTVEIYANTEPLPADDDGVGVFKGVASDPKSFFMPYHVPKFYYEPQYIYTTGDNSLPNWKEEGGVISANLDVKMHVDEDTWVVVFVSGTPGTKGFKPLFPLVTKSNKDPSVMQKPEKGWTLEALQADPSMSTPAWGFANPIFIDTDGDTNGDGNPFEAKYLHSGISPLAK